MMAMLDATREEDADHRFAAAAVERFIDEVMAAVGLPAPDAAKVAQLMTEADLTGALTDAPIGKDLPDLPYDEMLRAHALWCETQGSEGHPSVFDGADLRRLVSIKGFNLTALSAKGAIFYALDMEGVQLQGAQLEGADFRSANLRRADLRGARMSRAKLNGADLREAQLTKLRESDGP